MRLRLRLMAAGAAVLLAATACGGGNDSATGTDDGSAPAETAAASDTAGGETASDAASQDSAAGGDGLAGVLTEVEGLSADERRAKLIELAEEEGTVALYTSLNEDIAQELIGAFEDIADVEVQTYRASSETVRTRLIEEGKANVGGADVVETNGPEMVALNTEAVLYGDYSPPNADDLVEGAAQKGWWGDRFNIFTVGWNTSAVPDPPTTYQDLADPKWDGRFAMELKDADWYFAVYNYLIGDGGLSEEEADELFRGMAEGAAFVKGHSNMREMVVAGQFDLMASDYSYGVQKLVDDGAPIAWQPSVEPLFARPNGVAPVATAPHPAAAVLFTDWLLSDGQEVLKELAIDPVRKDIASTGDADVRTLDLETYLAEQDKWDAKYQDLSRLGQEG